jgi:hypothetical protein
VIEHFRVLPTDQRYKELTDDQIELLFHSYLLLPDDDSYKAMYQDHKHMRDSGLPEESDLKESGYSADEIRQMIKDLESL